MKKICVFMISFVFAFTLGVILSSCGNSDPPAAEIEEEYVESETEIPAPDEFSVFAESSSDHVITLSSKTGKYKETIYLKIEVLNSLMEIDSVLANNVNCHEIEDEYYDYYFVMPNENVQITVNLKEKIPVVLDNILAWQEAPLQTLTITDNVEYQTYNFYFLQPVEISSMADQVIITSSNLNCLPQSAILDLSLFFNDQNMASAGSFKIDLSQLSEGQASISLKVLSNQPLASCTISLNLEFITYQEPTVHGNTILFDFSLIEANSFYITILNFTNFDFLEYTTSEKLFSININCNSQDILYIEIFADDYYMPQITLSENCLQFASFENNELVFFEEGTSVVLLCQ